MTVAASLPPLGQVPAGPNYYHPKKNTNIQQRNFGTPSKDQKDIMADSDYGNLSTLLSDHQGLLRKGDLVRVLSSGGSWNDHQVHGKGKGCWVNVSDVGGSEPNFSVRLVPGGRWYRISVPGERLAFLEGDTDPTEEDESHLSGAQGTNTEPTILNAGHFEAGGGLTTPGDRDNMDHFYQLIQNPLRENAEDDFGQMIPELH